MVNNVLPDSLTTFVFAVVAVYVFSSVEDTPASLTIVKVLVTGKLGRYSKSLNGPVDLAIPVF